MGKNKKKKAKSPPGRSEATARRKDLPEARDPESLIRWWSDALTGGFSPLGAEENLEQCRRYASSPGQKKAIEALHRLIPSSLGESRPLANAPAVPSAALVDQARGRIFISGADGSGLACLESDTGRKTWHLNNGRFRYVTGMALSDTTLFVCDRWTGRLIALNADQGSEIWSTENAACGEKLAEPSDVALIGKGSGSEIWVCDRGKHGIFRYSPDSTPLGRIGRRGMLAEEIIRRFTKPASEPDSIHLEFPLSLSVGNDTDGEPTVFVWDSWNRRVLCLATDGKLKRQVLLDRIKDSDLRFAGQVKILPGPCGPVILEIDDCRTALIVWTAEGDLLLNLELKEALFGPSKKCELFRLACAAKGDGPHYLVTSRSRLFELDKSLLDTAGLLDSLAVLRPDDNALALARYEAASNCGLGEPAISRRRENVKAGISTALIANQLSSGEDTLNGRLETLVGRLTRFAGDLSGTGADKSAREIHAAVGQRLDELMREALEKLNGLTELDPKEENAWIEALTDLDIAMFQNSGKIGWEEIILDGVLEKIRKYPDNIRRTAWQLRTLNRLSAPGLISSRNEVAALEFARMAEKLLLKRREVLDRLGENLSFGNDPQRIIRDEIKLLHRSILNLKAAEQVAGYLAGEISGWLEKNADSSSEELQALLFRCSKAASGLPQWDELYETGADRGAALHDQTDFETTESEKPVRDRLEELKALVENMEAYLKKVGGTSNLNTHFSKVVSRQKEIFAVKASVLAGQLAENGGQASPVADLLERAGRLAGEAWQEAEYLRKHSAKGVVRA